VQVDPWQLVRYIVQLGRCTMLRLGLVYSNLASLGFPELENTQYATTLVCKRQPSTPDPPKSAS